MGSLKLPHASGNSMSIAAPATNPAADRTINLNDDYAGNGSFVLADTNGDVGLGTAPNNFGSYKTLHIKGPSNEGAAIRLQDNGDTADSNDAAIYKNSSALYLRVNGTDPLIAYMNGAERMRLNSSGKLLVGRTSDITITGDGTSHVFEQNTDNGYALATHSNHTNKRGIGIYYPSGGTPSDAIRFAIDSAAKFIVLGDGDVQNADNSYGSISDSSLKENIVDANSQWNDIKNIKIRNYNFKASTGYGTHKQIGVVAQELETVCPKLVDTGEDNIKTVASSILYMKAVKALQEAMAKIETLETKVAALESS